MKLVKPVGKALPADLIDAAHRDELRALAGKAEPMPQPASAWSRRLASLLRGGRRRREETVGIILLEDIRMVFTERAVDRLTSASLVEALVAREDRLWPEWSKGGPISQNTASPPAQAVWHPPNDGANSLRAGQRLPLRQLRRRVRALPSSPLRAMTP
jgi:hypothetical protein